MSKPSDQDESGKARGRLSVVGTPIGNLGDLSARAREVLGACDLIAAEDTRHTANLLRHLSIDKLLVSLHEHNERERSADLVRRMLEGAHIALVSDAGTPAISDPGYWLVRAAAQNHLEICAVPGPCAAISALSIAGLPADRFCFEGFLPAQPGARNSRLNVLAGETRTMIFYEAPHRIVETMVASSNVFGAARAAVVAREITKRFETIYRGTIGELVQRANQDADFARGEIVLIVAGAPEVATDVIAVELDRLLRILLDELPLKQAANLASKISGARANESYRRALLLKGGAN